VVDLLPPEPDRPSVRERLARGGGARLAEAGLALVVAGLVGGWYWTSTHPSAGDAVRPAAPVTAPTPVARPEIPAPRLRVGSVGPAAERAAGVVRRAVRRAPRPAQAGWVIEMDGRRLPVRRAPVRRAAAPAAAPVAPAAADPTTLAPPPAPAADPVAFAPVLRVPWEVISDAAGHESRILEPREPEVFCDRCQGGWPSNVAVDLAAPAGSAVYAPFAGIVTYAFDRSGIGPTTPGWGVAIDSGAGRAVFMTHLDRLRVRVGDRVAQGQAVGVVGDHFTSIPDHVHLGMGRAWSTPGMSAGIDPGPVVAASAANR
jgi:murein DD-endopeptidase MepM/ murein hydrolase activator NlpD